ncbi:MAG: type II toxin-antitoxin system RelE/ParE family toxin [Pyrinomonadaceae bacterium]|nr:type II toxin-antitoxin system RelE/ParE family toxin [Pyrinomonadaceae bacterium]
MLTDDEYAEFQWRLVRFPEEGAVIPNSGGIRKIRGGAKGKGKRGGARVIYYLAIGNGVIFLLDIYAKNEKADLSSFELKFLKNTVEEWLKDE